MNRTTFLFLALLIASCIVTVNSRHEARTLITQKTVLAEKVTSLQESIRRLELANARFSAKTCPLPNEVATGATPRQAAPKPAAVKSDDAAPAQLIAPKASDEPDTAPPALQRPAPAPGPTTALKTASSKHAVVKDEDALTKMLDKALKK